MLQFLINYGYIIFTALLIPAFIFAGIAQGKVTKTYNTFKRIDTEKNKKAYEVAEQMLNDAGINYVKVQRISGALTDNFDPSTKVVSLSEDVYDSCSVAAIGIAAHEVGHAIQYHQKYFPIKLRMFTIRVCNLTSNLLMPLLIIGILLSSWGLALWGIGLIGLSIFTFVLSFLISLITLPVEYNASNRALKILSGSGALTTTETSQAKRVLRAAALTYVASALISLLGFLRILFYILGATSKKRK